MKHSILAALAAALLSAAPIARADYINLSSAPIVRFDDCIWMFVRYHCTLKQYGWAYYMIFTDKRGEAYQWRVSEEGDKQLMWARDSI